MMEILFDEMATGTTQEGKCITDDLTFSFRIRNSVVDTTVTDFSVMPKEIIVEFLQKLLEEDYVRLVLGKYKIFRNMDLEKYLFEKDKLGDKIVNFPERETA